ncbi:DNA polymerase IV [Desulfogranum marinum]|uniref:DNA polymerase IV n=1 Tax=Desulfogranum marinum TaxID=453220 RepID=UPI0029C7D626|nr:DNA polymerase IV [Desulfogranum marinum]
MSLQAKNPSLKSHRKIIHIDMDAFFASVEQLDNPALRGKPVIVGGAPQGRGVVAACSYEARAFGIHSAMPSARAYTLCRHAVFVRPRKERYQEVSHQIRAIFSRYSPLVEPLSIDEAFLDTTVNTLNNPSATHVAQIIRGDIYRTTGLTASAGVSYNKFLAKLASDQDKPDGLTVITPQKARSFLRSLPIRRFYGVGKVTEQKMHGLGIRTGRDLEKFSQAALTAAFGSSGCFFYDMARGIDNRPVQPHQTRKSIGTETTFQEDIYQLEEVLNILQSLANQVGNALSRKKIGGRTLSLKVRYDDFTTISRSCSKRAGFYSQHDIWQQVPPLVAATEAGRRKIRLLGLTISNLLDEIPPGGLRYEQLLLPFYSKEDNSPTTLIAKIRQANNYVDCFG